MTLQLKVFIGLLLTIALILFIIASGYAWVLVLVAIGITALIFAGVVLGILWEIADNIAIDLQMWFHRRERKKRT